MNKFIILGLTIAILVAVSAQFFAATDPDGLESTLEKIKTPGIEEKSSIESPMSDYKISFLGDSPISHILAAFIGIFMLFGLVYGVGMVLKKRKS